MTTAAAEPSFALQRGDAGALVRWPACLALVLALHAAAFLALLLPRANTMEPLAAPVEAIMMDLAPEPEPDVTPVAEEVAPAESEPEPAEAPPPPPEPVAEALPAPDPPPEPPEPVVAVPHLVLPQPPPPPPLPPEQRPPAPRPIPRPQAPQRPPAENQRPAQPAATAAPTAPAAPASNAVPTWQGQLLGRLQRHKRYPDLARSRREEGVVHLTFSLDREGRVLSAIIAKGSGSVELDAETLALVRRAEPLPPPPPEMPGNPVTLTVPVRFSLR
jgi:periplasmic protein TonB